MPASSVSDEISHLMRKGPSKGPQRGRKMGQRQAIAVALNEARKGKFGKRSKRKARRGTR